MGWIGIVNGQTTKPAATQPQFDPKAAEILKQTVEKYQGCKTYQDQGKVIYQAKTEDGQDIQKSFDVKLVFERPNRIHFVWPSLTLACDGARCQVYYPDLQQYTDQAPPAVINGSYLKDALMEENLTLVLTSLVGEQPYATIVSTIKKLEYEGTVEKGGRTFHKVYFVEGTDRTDLLIDAQTMLINQVSIYPAKAKVKKWQLQVDYSKVEINGKIDPAEFKIEAPKGAKKVDRISFTRQYDYPKLGQAFPETQLDVLGTDQKKSVNNLLGSKLTLVSFWATWCPPCLTELPDLEALYKEYKSQGVQFIGISVDMDTPADEVQRTIQEMGLTFPNLLDQKSELGDAMLVEKVPMLLVLDKTGKVLQAHVGATKDTIKEFRWIIQHALQENPTGKP